MTGMLIKICIFFSTFNQHKRHLDATGLMWKKSANELQKMCVFSLVGNIFTSCKTQFKSTENYYLIDDYLAFVITSPPFMAKFNPLKLEFNPIKVKLILVFFVFFCFFFLQVPLQLQRRPPGGPQTPLCRTARRVSGPFQRVNRGAPCRRTSPTAPPPPPILRSLTPRLLIH